MYPLPTVQPTDKKTIEFIQEVCGIYFRSVLLEDSGTVIPQHTHSHDHATYVGSGKVRLWVDGKWLGDFPAGQAIGIEKDKFHLFQSLEPNTRLTCVHDLHSAALIKLGV
jgi:hypothetical protein